MLSKINRYQNNKSGKIKLKSNKVRHEFKVLSPDYINDNRSKAYDYIVTT